MRDSFPHIIAILAGSTLTLAGVGSGCVVPGKLDPHIQPFVATVDTGACKFVPVSSTVGPVSGEVVCELVAGIVNEALALFSAHSLMNLKSAAALVPAEVVYRGRVLYRGAKAKCDHLRDLLTEVTPVRIKVDAALDAAGIE